ncbi:amidohydrolase family protein [Nakamurella sp. YIM 132087]|uniref:Amidohydrolase family protein n=1 Tax=Nakamurella alba TaxID=2665158 RepID=A0A7K1FGZ7_9ACTN|nr:amidohydrolase [Nakamurella alba]MTD13392.1 amidohydrolase family protein [Nakamurella alba]
MTAANRIVGATVWTGEHTLHDAEIVWSVETGTIEYVGPSRGPAGDGDIDGTGRLVLPGFVNGHTHAGMGVLRGYSDDVHLHTWLGHVRAIELRMTADDILAGLRLAMAEMLRSGTVGFVDMFEWTTPLLGAVVDAGLRVNAAPTVFAYDAVAFPSAATATGAQVLDATPGLAAEFAGEQRITVTYGLHAPYTCPPEMLSDVAARRADNGIGIQIHLSETRREVAESLEQWGVSPIRHVADLGLLPGRLHVAHAVHPEPGDLGLLAGPGVTVSHNPVSNLKLGAGIAPVPEYLAGDVALGLGTDSVASNNTLDMYEELKTAILLPRGVANDPQVITGRSVLKMATAGSAKALDQGLSGVLAIGEQADLQVLDVSGTTAAPFTDAVSFACYAARGSDVTDVVIAGRVVVSGGRCLTIDEDAVRAEVTERATRLRGELADGDPRPVRS